MNYFPPPPRVATEPTVGGPRACHCGGGFNYGHNMPVRLADVATPADGGSLTDSTPNTGWTGESRTPEARGTSRFLNPWQEHPCQDNFEGAYRARREALPAGSMGEPNRKALGYEPTVRKEGDNTVGEESIHMTYCPEIRWRKVGAQFDGNGDPSPTDPVFLPDQYGAIDISEAMLRMIPPAVTTFDTAFSWTVRPAATRHGAWAGAEERGGYSPTGFETRPVHECLARCLSFERVAAMRQRDPATQGTIMRIAVPKGRNAGHALTTTRKSGERLPAPRSPAALRADAAPSRWSAHRGHTSAMKDARWGTVTVTSQHHEKPY